MRKTIQIDFSPGYLEMIIRLKNRELIHQDQITELLNYLVYQNNKALGCKSDEEWDIDHCIEFMKKLNPSFNISENSWWKVKKMRDTISELLFKNLSPILNENSLTLAILIPLIPICKKIFISLIKQKSICNKNYWLKFVTGSQKQTNYSKSGGNFVVKRYLQGKSSFYRRMAVEEGDQSLNKKL